MYDCRAEEIASREKNTITTEKDEVSTKHDWWREDEASIGGRELVSFVQEVLPLMGWIKEENNSQNMNL